jgi:23S rRNA pseudouridine2605 synthase
LNAYLASAGVASRRGAEPLITAGRVTVNGVVVTTLATKVNDTDIVTLDGKPLTPAARLYYIAMNKPKYYLCSTYDPEGRPLARDLLPPQIHERLYNVGRLDFMSEGLLLFTNDGAFTQGMTHPSSEIEKEYIVETSTPIPQALPISFRQGITIDDELYRSRHFDILGRRSFRVVLTEGRNREIRNVLAAFHLRARTLRRIRIGNITLGDLALGATRFLSPQEINETAD